ncbi:hypothetical protein [Candidatus Accumulibacter cognatus]|uniref:Uncharacterized protein n=1 Tax=Candidatus Accumulibacter cognatus TaxID=2954383 RepID=A0A080M4Y1_9PROT|nr:hypothetical protein [Candidatus Accumulibacter cognatus]KFB76268.1 MAG: hypothetical protein AW06_002690 [Candidatus Accumulibacter cognatus]
MLIRSLSLLQSLLTNSFLLIVGVMAAGSVVAQPVVASADQRYMAQLTGLENNRHYIVRVREGGVTVLTTRAKYPENDVKSGAFGTGRYHDRFAAAYHYAHGGNHTWIGVWNLTTGTCESAIRIAGFEYNAARAFARESSPDRQPDSCPKP